MKTLLNTVFTVALFISSHFIFAQNVRRFFKPLQHAGLFRPEFFFFINTFLIGFLKVHGLQKFLVKDKWKILLKQFRLYTLLHVKLNKLEAEVNSKCLLRTTVRFAKKQEENLWKLRRWIIFNMSSGSMIKFIKNLGESIKKKNLSFKNKNRFLPQIISIISRKLLSPGMFYYLQLFLRCIFLKTAKMIG